MSDPLGPVVITGREIYDQMVRVVDAVSGLGTKVDRLTDDSTNVKADLVDHETRIRTLERERWPKASVTILISIATVLVSVGTLVAVIVLK